MFRISPLILLSAFQLFSISAFLFAQPQQSENFRITKSVLDAGGGASTSTNFRLVSAFGQPTPIGVSSSTNFVLSAGFLSPSFAQAPNSPIDLVIYRQAALSNDMKLDWSAVSGATSYTIYRDVTSTFTPSGANQIGTSGTNTFTDVGAVGLVATKYFYIVTATGSGAPMASTPGSASLSTAKAAPDAGAIIAKTPELKVKETGSASKSR